MLILYITYVNMDSAASGSGVRPQKMYRAFLNEGHTVYLLGGSQATADRETREAAVEETSRWLDSHRPDLCYIESPVYPILLRSDRELIRKIHSLGIPMGYFCRDFYWKFPDKFPKRRDPAGWLKDTWLNHLQRVTDRLLECMDIVYFPSAEAARYFPYRDMRPLPPAGENRLPETAPEGKNCLYVGGLDSGYGVSMLLDAFHLLNAKEPEARLLLICREKEWDAFRSPWKQEPWLEVHHTSGDGLEPLYARASLAVIPVELFEYNHLSVNVKLFEYLGHGLPVVTTEARALAAFVRENDIGTAVPYDAEAMAAALGGLLEDTDRMAGLRDNCRRSLLEGNLWVHRVRQIVNDLGGRQ